MKKIVMGLVTLSFSIAAQATPRLEPVNVVEIETIRNLMPPGPHEIYSLLDVKVWSSGCTKEADFRIDVKQTAGAQRLRIVRTKFDPCKAVQRLTNVELRTDKLVDGKAIVLENPQAQIVQTVH